MLKDRSYDRREGTASALEKQRNVKGKNYVKIGVYLNIWDMHPARVEHHSQAST
jgi:hypothetical protein